AEAQLHAGLTQHSGTEGARVGGATSDTAGHEHAVRKATDQLHGVGTDRRTQVVRLSSSLVQLALVVTTVPDVSDTARQVAEHLHALVHELTELAGRVQSSTESIRVAVHELGRDDA